MTLPVVFTANGPTGYNLTKSLRFRQPASAYLNRTPASAGSLTTWTYSVWVKKGAFPTNSANYQSFLSYSPGGANEDLLSFGALNDEKIYFYVYTSGYVGQLVTSQVFRDYSSWYHLVFVWDTTQATSSNRMKVYVNGVQVTAFSTANYPAQNATSNINTAGLTYIGRYGNSNAYTDSYLTEVNFIDGQALTPSSFGSTNAQTGVWQPAKYTGTYGTNGFYLPFTDNSALTSGSNAGLGKDFSGNGNYWNTNNISITSGSTYDSMTDVPTLTSATQANYCVLNPVNVSGGGSTITDGNLACNAGSTSTYGKILGSVGMTTGKWYCEVTVTAIGSLGAVGLGDGTPPSGSTGLGGVAGELSYLSNGNKYTNATATAYGATYTTNDIIGIAYDADAGSVTFYKNNTSQGAITGLSGIKYFAVGSSGGTNPQYVANFGQRPFAYTPPTGFVALNTYNLPTPTIGATASTLANKNMDVSLWTGNSSSPRNITNNGGFQPDLVWSKVRNDAYGHMWFDSVRGAGGNKELGSNSTGAEGYASSAVYGYTSSFNSNGFTVTAGTDASIPNAYCNQNSLTYVGWQWKANGSAVSNTAGSITSQVSANTSAGFSVVTFTAGSGNQTVGHGLGVAPNMVILKRRNSTSAWITYHSSLSNPATSFLELNTTAAVQSATPIWGASGMTSTTIGTSDNITINGATYVAYCFSEIAGYSKFGSYVGNGNANGPFIYTGFRPRYVLIKSTGVEDWRVFDTARSTYNIQGATLYPNTSSAENAGQLIDINSNGFKCRTTDGAVNGSSTTYIYMAFAENPFKYSLAR